MPSVRPLPWSVTWYVGHSQARPYGKISTGYGCGSATLANMDGPEREALGRRGVTRRELDVLEAVAERLSNAEIAARLCVSERTVESHVSSLLHKFGVGTRVELASRAGVRQPGRKLGDAIPPQLNAVAQRGICVGRDEERERLLACWERSAARTIVAVVRGEAGIGKSRLAAEVAVEVHRRGGGVALGTCMDGPQRPYGSFMAAIEADLAGRSHDELARRLASSAVTFARLSPDVAARLEVVEQDVVAPEWDRAAVQGALLDYLSSAARARRLLFVIEDLHWASTGTRDVVTHLARAGGDAPLMLLVTARDEGPFIDDAFVAFLGRLARLPSVEMIALSGLDVIAAARLIAAMGGDLDPAEGVRQTGGNPLFLRELASDGPGSRSLRELVADRFTRLNAADLDVLDLAAVAGEQIDVPLLSSALDRSLDEVLDALERAEIAGLIGPGARAGCFAFSHDVYRSVRYTSLTSSRRFRLHAALAHALGDRAGHGPVSADLAQHACLAGPRFDAATAAELARRAGDAATHASDYGEAVAHYRRALAALELVDGADDDVRLDIVIRLGAALRLLGEPDGLAMLYTAARAAREREDPVCLAAAICAMETLPGGSAFYGRVDEEFRSLAETALQTLPRSEEPWRIRVSVLLGVQRFLTDPERGTEMIRAAVAAARRLDDPVTLGRTLMSYRWCGSPMDTDQRMACGQELIELGDQTGVQIFAVVGRQQLCWCHRELGNRDEMDYWDHEAARRVRGPDIEQLGHAAAVALIEGDLDRAEQLTRQIEEISHPGDAGHVYSISLRAALDDWRERTRDLNALEHQILTGHLPDVLEAFVARRWARRGHFAHAQEMLDKARCRGFAPMHSGHGGSTRIAFWAETAAIVGDTAASQELGTILEPMAGRFADSGVVVLDTIDRLLALLRLATGDTAAAAEFAARAVAASRRRRTPIFLGRELVALAAATQRLGADANASVEEALTIARRTGARMIARDAELFLTAPPPASPDDPSALTLREREILDLVAEGATNSQIATALSVSPATVRKHLEHVYSKLNVATRTAAVARRNAGNTTRTRPSGQSSSFLPVRAKSKDESKRSR